MTGFTATGMSHLACLSYVIVKLNLLLFLINLIAGCHTEKITTPFYWMRTMSART